MRLFGKRNDELGGLEHELRRRRPQPRSEFLEQHVSRIQASEPRRFALRSRVSVAVATTALLCVAAGATGGLSYASAATSHTMHAFVHVFGSPNSERRSAPVQFTQNATASQSATATGANFKGQTHSAVAHALHESDAGAFMGQTQSAVSHALNQNGNSAAQQQYTVFVFVCLAVPPQHPFVFITLRIPGVAADRLIERGLATPGPCGG